MQDLETLRSVSILKILGLRNTGRRMSMRCPFPNHNDKTPSFCIYADNSYRCFGCNLFGANAVDFALHVNGATNLKTVSKEDFKKALDDLKDYVR